MKITQSYVNILLNGLLDIIPASKIYHHTELVNFIQSLNMQIDKLTNERDQLKEEINKLKEKKE